MVVQMAVIGKVIAPFGIKGAVKIYPYTDFPERYRLLKKVKLEGKGFSQFKVIQKARRHKNLWILHFEDCCTRDEAQKLVDLLVKIPSAQRMPCFRAFIWMRSWAWRLLPWGVINLATFRIL